jgi:hypothetical protein
MINSHDEIKNLLKASRTMLSNSNTLEESIRIKKQYGMLTEQDVNMTSGDTTKKLNVGDEIETALNYDEDEETNPEKDKTQAYRISGGILVIHGKTQTELELTTDEKIAFQETMDEFVTEVSDLVDFNKLNVYPNNVEWSGKIIDFDVEFTYSIGEENGIYIDGEMMKMDDKFIEFVTKLKAYYEKFKSKWAIILASRKKTKKTD